MPEKEEKLHNIRHSLAHLLAAAVLELYPDTKRTIGPAIENGFYFDFEFSRPISDADLPKIEKKMRQILPDWDRFSRHELDAAAAKKEYTGNEFKHELIDEFTENGKKKVTFYKSGNYWDLCRGGHVDSMRQISPDSFTLTHTAGAYWRGNEKNKMLTRIYGLAFETKKELGEYLAMLEEAKKRDHKKLGRDLDLFVFSDLVGPGLPLWTPKGTILRNTLDDFVWELRHAHGYQKVEIPHITKKELYEKSGHWDKFKDELFNIKTREGHIFAMKPMNCPHHIEIYRRKMWSYRELPQRYANTTVCYRDEQTGELSGFSRLRAFTQDDAHVFCRESQIETELLKVWDIVTKFYKPFGLKLRLRLSLFDPKALEKYLGDKLLWKKAEDIMRKIAKNKKLPFFEAPGEAAFYGPKLDFMAKDSLGREWQVATIQLDMNMPERFDLTCINEQGQPERIYMLHAAIMGSIERFLAVIIEHLAGAFPVWLAPVQVAVLPITDKQNKYAKDLVKQLVEQNIRVELDDRNESIGKKIREASRQKIPYMLILGEKEMKAKKVAVRKGDKDLGSQTIKKFLEKIETEIAKKTL
ncbi:MAG: threonine--tRNA ligase [Candidatus Doudnabacteria bacterium RIFCSPHIGHO2_02_FULL_46_11]|uniref:Threonine--tRNA ligase n=1 Tax=Candidatus Doudnabacteria bacterium RIFCSPHIGHO2_02_FULL_46_11 TaxID=1817832 RepID=A0A1F5P4W3_9BACT|nr:MAG: threonine--tRNA ligase [Candidatus Doudnabacteria bacterium RIFCSPHIGHO2_02_FULL_46_11]